MPSVNFRARNFIFQNLKFCKIAQFLSLKEILRERENFFFRKSGTNTHTTNRKSEVFPRLPLTKDFPYSLLATANTVFDFLDFVFLWYVFDLSNATNKHKLKNKSYGYFLCFFEILYFIFRLKLRWKILMSNSDHNKKSWQSLLINIILCQKFNSFKACIAFLFPHIYVLWISKFKKE